MTTDANAQSSGTPEVKPLPRRRWFQFSLRTMLAWVTVIAVLLAVGKLWVAPAERQRATVEFVEKLGGHVSYTYPPAEETWLVRQLRDWLPPDYFDDVIEVDFSGTQVTDAGLVYLKELTKLEILSLDGTQVTDAGLVYLKELTTLKGLSFEDSQVTDAGLVHLKDITALESLSLIGTQVSDTGLVHLKELKSLVWLSLIGTQVSDAGLVHLKELTALKILWLDGTQVTDAGIADLRVALPNCTM